MWALNFTNEINFKCYKNIFRANQEWETSRARTKCLNGRGPCWWAEIGSSPACHIRTPGPDTSPLMDLDLAKQALASRGTFCQNARKHTRWHCHHLLYDPQFCSRAAKSKTLVWEFILPQVWKAVFEFPVSLPAGNKQNSRRKMHYGNQMKLKGEKKRFSTWKGKKKLLSFNVKYFIVPVLAESKSVTFLNRRKLVRLIYL